jgi:putative transposase
MQHRRAISALPSIKQEACMSQAEESCAQRWARFRFFIIGPLLAAPPNSGEGSKRLAELAAVTYRHPITGEPVRFGASSIERWYYRAKDASNPTSALRTRIRSDRGLQPSICARVEELIVEQHRANPDWTFQLIYDNVAVTAAERDELTTIPSYPTFVRFMHAKGLKRHRSRKNMRPNEIRALEHKEKREVRSFEMSHVHALWHLDFHVGSRKILRPDGTFAAPHIMCVLDDRSRLVCHAQWYWTESAQCLVHGLTQALQKRGLPRALLTDNGAAMVAEETTRGLVDLDITHDTTMAYSPYQNGKQEVFWGQIEGRLLPMLGNDPNLTIEALNDATQAWVEMEYQHKKHRETHCAPAARSLAGPTVNRPCPENDVLRFSFTTQSTRLVRQGDGTVSVDGQRFEVPSRLRALRRLTIRYARWDLRHVWAVDEVTNVILSALYPQDKIANADRQRRAIPTPMSPLTTSSDSPQPMAPLMRTLIQQYAADGAPPAYLAGPNSIASSDLTQ